MDDQRLVGIDLGITSAHTVRVLSGDGTIVCRRKAVPTLASLVEVERAALVGAMPGICLEVVRLIAHRPTSHRASAARRLSTSVQV